MNNQCIGSVTSNCGPFGESCKQSLSGPKCECKLDSYYTGAKCDKLDIDRLFGNNNMVGSTGISQFYAPNMLIPFLAGLSIGSLLFLSLMLFVLYRQSTAKNSKITRSHRGRSGSHAKLLEHESQKTRKEAYGGLPPPGPPPTGLGSNLNWNNNNFKNGQLGTATSQQSLAENVCMMLTGSGKNSPKLSKSRTLDSKNLMV